MNPGYIYILQNRSFSSHLIKIGMTTREPDIRAKEIYRGASGVPEPFDIVFACQVADCRAAEKAIHWRLRAYRINKNREFFITPVKIAKRVSLGVCQKINQDSNYSANNPVIIEKQTIDDSKNFVGDPPGVINLRVGDMILSSPGTNLLSNEQEERVEIIAEILRDVSPGTCKEWLRDFSRDRNPEKEIGAWENIAKAFLRIEQVKLLSENQKKEAFAILLMRSMTSASKVLKEFELKAFSRKSAKEILSGYQAPPMPLTVEHSNF